jgi:hypothetical protein
MKYVYDIMAAILLLVAMVCACCLIVKYGNIDLIASVGILSTIAGAVFVVLGMKNTKA